MSITRISISVPSSGDGPSADVSALLGPKTVQLAGLFRGTYVLLGSEDDADFVPILSFNAGSLAGITQTVPGAFKSMKLRSMATGTGVSCVVSGVSSGGQNYFATVATLTSGFSGASPVVDTAGIFPPSGPEADICFLCRGSFRGLLTVMGSMNGTVFNPIGSWRTDSLPAGGGGVLEFSALTTEDKTRYVQILLDGVATGTVSVTMGGSVPTQSGTNPGADWPLNLVRFVFADGDGGNDSHVGYIDAPPGTVFTPAQAAAVAIKTTSRVDEVRPAVGNGRMIVTLWKPRANFTPYDYKVEGDGLGVCNRARMSGYSLIHDRGSDLTNSSDLSTTASDKMILGYVVSAGPWPVESVTPIAFGTELVLTGLNLSNPLTDLMPYRLRVTKADGSVFTSLPRWGDTTNTGRTNVVTARPVGDLFEVGDLVAFDQPGTVIPTVTETQSSLPNVLHVNPLLVAGISASTCSLLGANDVTTAPLYVGISTTETCQVRWSGSAKTAALYEDEAGATYPDWTPGWICKSTDTENDAAPLPPKLVLDYVVGLAELDVAASLLTSDSGFFNDLHLTNPVARVVLTNPDYVRMVWQAGGSGDVSGATHLPLGGGSVMIFSEPVGSYSPNRTVTLHGAVDMWPDTSQEGIRLENGEYEVVVETESVSLGTGVRINTSSSFAHVSYASLAKSGFDVVGGQKVTCLTDDVAHYPERHLPCPRSRVGLWVASEGAGDPVPVGSVVCSSFNQPGRVMLASLESPYEAKVAGFLAAEYPNTEASGAPCIVSADPRAVLLLESGEGASPYPAPGDLLYLSALVNGAVTQVPPPRGGDLNVVGPVRVARAIDQDWDGTSSTVEALFLPTPPDAQVATLATPFSKTSSDLASVPELFVQLEAGHTYKVDLVADVGGGGSGGYQFALSSPNGGTASSALLASMLTQATPTQDGVVFNDAVYQIGDTHSLSGGVGTTSGRWTISGFVTIDLPGILEVRFAQSVTNANSNSITSAVLSAVAQS